MKVIFKKSIVFLVTGLFMGTSIFPMITSGLNVNKTFKLIYNIP